MSRWAAAGGQPLDARLALPALAAWVAAWQGRVLPRLVLVLLVVLLSATALLLLRAGRSLAAAVCVCAAAGAVATGARAELRSTGPLPGLASSRAAVVVHGVLVDDPRRAGDVSRQVVVARVRVDRLTTAGRVVRLRAPVLVLSTDRDWLSLLPSQRIRVEGRLGAAERGDDVAAVLSARGPPAVLSGASAVQRVAGRLRAGLRDAVRPLPAAEQGLLPGLVVGDVSHLDPTLRDDFRTTGLSHLVAVSGTNVAIVVGAALLLARAVGLGLVGAPAVSALALAGFVVLARPSPSVLRAAVMGVVGLIALVGGGRRSAMPALSAAVLVLVLVQPELAAAPGFALSVLATAGLLVLAPPWRTALARRVPGWLANALAVPAAAQLACGPVVVAISGTLGLSVRAGQPARRAGGGPGDRARRGRGPGGSAVHVARPNLRVAGVSAHGVVGAHRADRRSPAGRRCRLAGRHAGSPAADRRDRRRTAGAPARGSASGRGGRLPRRPGGAGRAARRGTGLATSRLVPGGVRRRSG